MFYQLKNLINSLTFPLRNKIAFSRPIKNIPGENKKNLFKSEGALLAEQYLINKYHLAKFKSNSSIIHYKENLYTLKLLDDIFQNTTFDWDKSNLSILDIGSKNFSYAYSLHSFFRQFHPTLSVNRSIQLDGIEIDPYKIMSDMHSRYDYAQYYIKNLDNTKYITGNFLSLQDKKYDIITWFLPFITKEPLLNWGLPLKYYKPETQLKHAYNLLKHRGIILVVNQTEREKNFQLHIIQNLGLNYIEIEKPYTNLLSPYKYDRHITIITKGNNV